MSRMAAPQPRAPKGTTQGGQWLPAARPDDILPNTIILSSEQPHENVPQNNDPTKIKLSIFDKQRTVKHDGEQWAIHRLPTSSRIFRKMSEGLQLTVKEAVDLAAIGIVDMLNEGSIDVDNIREYFSWVDESYVMGDLGRGVAHGIYKSLPYNLKQYSQVPDDLKRVVTESKHGTSPSMNLVFSIAKFKGLQLGHEMQHGPGLSSVETVTAKEDERDLVENVLKEMFHYQPFSAMHGTKRQVFRILGDTTLPYHNQTLLCMLKDYASWISEILREHGEDERKTQTMLCHWKAMVVLALGVLGTNDISDDTQEEAFELLDELMVYDSAIQKDIRHMINYAVHPYVDSPSLDGHSEDMLLALDRILKRGTGQIYDHVSVAIHEYEKICSALPPSDTPEEGINRLREYCASTHATLETIKDRRLR